MLNAYKFYIIAHRLYNYNLVFFSKIIKLFIFVVYNCSIPFEARIGKGTKFAYGGISVIIHKRTIIGKNCNIGSNVTIGGRSGFKDVPIIGDNVMVGTGAKILGPVKIGDNVKIGANAVVLSDLPSNSIAVGIPAKIIKHENIN